MNKLKDFLYNKNDIIIVLIILTIASFIIYTRIDAIMDYPEKLAKQTAATETESITQTESATELISIKINDSDTAADVSKKLYKAKLITSASDFKEYIKSQKKESLLKAGIFKIPAGSSQEEILNIIINQN